MKMRSWPILMDSPRFGDQKTSLIEKFMAWNYFFSIIFYFVCKCQTATTTIPFYPLCTLGAQNEHGRLDHFLFRYKSKYVWKKSSERPIDIPKLFDPGWLSILPSIHSKNIEKLWKVAFFLCSRPKMAVFQIFQDRFFHGPLISIQEGLLKTYILVSSLFAAENVVCVS